MRARIILTTIALATMLVAAPTHAAEVPGVLAVQSPTWVQRDGYSQALRAGFELQPGDVIRTGSRGRVHLRMPDDSIVKLGSGGRLQIEDMAVEETDVGEELLNATIRVFKGAFRFTTRALSSNYRRDVEVHIGVATAGIRGTDIWGSSDDERDLICLLEGEIAVRAEGYDPQVMDEPLDFYVVPTGQAPNPVGKVELERVLNVWAPQTEMDPELPVMTGGPWAVVLASYQDGAAAEQVARQLGEAGYPARLGDAVVGGVAYTRVLVTGFADRANAQAFISLVASEHAQFVSAWVLNTG